MKSSPTKQMTEEYTPAFPKAGKKVKPTKIWNKKVRVHDIDKPKERHCRRCERTTGSERFAHYEGFRKSSLGKGTGVKCDDNFTAWLCQTCTDTMDFKPKEGGLYIHSEEWLWLICKTHLL